MYETPLRSLPFRKHSAASMMLEALCQVEVSFRLCRVEREFSFVLAECINYPKNLATGSGQEHTAGKYLLVYARTEK